MDDIILRDHLKDDDDDDEDDSPSYLDVFFGPRFEAERIFNRCVNFHSLQWAMVWSRNGKRHDIPDTDDICFYPITSRDHVQGFFDRCCHSD